MSKNEAYLQIASNMISRTTTELTRDAIDYFMRQSILHAIRIQRRNRAWLAVAVAGRLKFQFIEVAKTRAMILLLHKKFVVYSSLNQYSVTIS